MFLTWVQFWTKYKFASSDMILAISQLLCQLLKHFVAKVDRPHPKSEVDILYISKEFLFPEICQLLWKVLSPVTAAWLLPTKEGWSILVNMLRSPCSTALPHSLQVLPLISHFCFLQRAEPEIITSQAWASGTKAVPIPLDISCMNYAFWLFRMTPPIA